MATAVQTLKLHYQEVTDSQGYVKFESYRNAREVSAYVGLAAAFEHDYGWFKTTQLVTSLYTYAMHYSFTAYFLSPVESDVTSLGRIISKGAAWFSAKALCTSTLRLVGVYQSGKSIERQHVTPVINSAAKVALFAGKTFIFAAFLMPYLRVFTAAKCMTDIYEKGCKFLRSRDMYLTLNSDYKRLIESKSRVEKNIADNPKVTFKCDPQGSQEVEATSVNSAIVNGKEVVVANFTGLPSMVSAKYVEEDHLELAFNRAYAECIGSCCEIAMAFIELTVTFVVGVPFSEEVILALWATVTATNMFSAYEGVYLDALSGVKV